MDTIFNQREVIILSVERHKESGKSRPSHLRQPRLRSKLTATAVKTRGESLAYHLHLKYGYERSLTHKTSHNVQFISNVEANARTVARIAVQR